MRVWVIRLSQYSRILQQQTALHRESLTPDG
jgi:hypothetical protein